MHYATTTVAAATATTTTLHYATLHYTYYTTLHDATLHYTTLHQLHCTTLQLLPYTKLDYTTLHYTTLHYTTQHYAALHYTNYTTPWLQMQLRLPKNDFTTLQLQLHYTTAIATTAATTALHHTTSSSCGKVTTATIATIPKKHSSNHLSVHQWIRSAIRGSQQPTSPIGFPFLKLPPPPFSVLLVAFWEVVGGLIEQSRRWRLTWIRGWSHDWPLRLDPYMTSALVSDWMRIPHQPHSNTLSSYSPPQCLGSLAGIIKGWFRVYLLGVALRFV